VVEEFPLLSPLLLAPFPLVLLLLRLLPLRVLVDVPTP
jgi:hypothetical protein